MMLNQSSAELHGPVPGGYPFGLDGATEDRAARLHREAIVFDMVSMYAGGAIFDAYPEPLRAELRAVLDAAVSRSEKMVRSIFWPFEMELEGRSTILRDWLLASGLTCGAFDIDLPHYDGGDPLASDWDERLRRCCELPWLRQVCSGEDIRQAKRDGVIGLYAFYQPVIPILRDAAIFDAAHARGLRAFMLTYNRMDHVGVGCTERVDAGLSSFGLEVVGRCNDLGIMVDVSHCGPSTTLDACRHSRKAVTANHSFARALYDHPRGKSDDALKAIADTGGVIGIVALPYFLSASPVASIEDMLDHIDHVAALVGWRHVAIGTDWPLQIPDDVLEETMGAADYAGQAGWDSRYRRDVTQRLIGYDDCRDLPNIARGLVARGYEDEQVLGILGGNALRVFEEVCG